jgi:peptidoglycan/xylan/chitin deacetylase (PgdA/CDA1 family)
MRHPDIKTLGNAAIDKELNDVVAFFNKHCNKVKPTIFRPPFGSITANQVRYINGKYNYTIGMWNLLSKDTEFTSSSAVAPHIRSQIPIYKGQSIISLHHDLKSFSVVANVIKEFRSAGYSFITMTQCARQCAPYANSAGVCRTPFGSKLINW